MTDALQNHKSKVAIVITTHKDKEVLSNFEELSLSQASKVFKGFDIFLVGPEGMNFSKYEKKIKSANIYLSPCFFGTISRYNRLMLSLEFYRHFDNYDYILIHHLDAFVFKDSLNDWCKMNFDYIGPVWLNTEYPSIKMLYRVVPLFDLITIIIKKIFVVRKNITGNGGLSLRKVSTFIRVLEKYRKKAERWQYNEDLFFSFIMPMLDNNFIIAPPKIAINFGFELDPRKMFEMNGKKLPFGCHAWSKYDVDFWRPIFRDYGYII